VKFLQVFTKTVREQSRDPLTLVLTLICAAFFVLLYKVMLPDSAFRCRILVYGDETAITSGIDYLETMSDIVRGGQWKGKSPATSVTAVPSADAGRELLRDGRADIMIKVGPALLEALASPSDQPVILEFEGDPASAQYQMGVVLIATAIEDTINRGSGRSEPVVVVERALGIAGEMTRFENYVPGLLLVSIIILVFGVAIAVAREVEAGTIVRLRLARIRAAALLGGYTMTYFVVGVISVLLAMAAAYLLGFRSAGTVPGDLAAVLLLCGLTSLSVIGIGLLVASVSRSVVQAFLISIFPVLLLLFFSGAFYPIPEVVVARVGRLQIGAYDVLPPTHAVTGLKKILIYGSGLGEITYELVSLIVLSAVFFFAGVLIFRKRLLETEPRRPPAERQRRMQTICR